jgi:predicted alpha-1,2-mannosidase
MQKIKLMPYFITLLLSLFCFQFSICQTTEDNRKVIDYVNPFIGTGGHGHTYPGATVPFGMVQLSPDNGTAGWDWCSGYNYSDSVIAGFSHTHLSGTGIGDLYDISVLPTANKEANAGKMSSRFSHKTESATPGYYAVRLNDFDIWAEMTTTIRCGMHRYTFPASDNSIIRFDLGFSLNWDETKETYFRKLNDSIFIGYRYSTGWAKNQKVYFAVQVSRTINDLILYADNVRDFNAETKGKAVVANLVFKTNPGEKILMKVGLSFADLEGAIESIQEIPHWNFDKVRSEAASTWERELRKVQIKTDDPNTKQTFYTALYHTYMAPTIFSDRFGNYKGINGEIKNGRMVFSTHSLWDTFRAANPLLTITQTEIVPAIINSYLAFYDQYGLLPVWDLGFNETNTMTGYHAVPIIADAIIKNIPGFDHFKAYEAMKASAMQDIRGTKMYRKYGYVPQDSVGSSATITLEYAYDDWCIAQVAKKLNKQTEFNDYIKRSQNWRNLFDRKRGFVRGKKSNGEWVEPFDPFYSEHDAAKAVYTEGNAWQHSFFAPHDVFALINFFRGPDRFANKIDSLFTVSSDLKGENISPDISGLIGQYAHGNEPSHHIAYLYTYAGKPWKNADRVKQIMKLYKNTPDGLCGNEDCGQMSAWYVFSALGFYPVNPVSQQYILGTPVAPESVIMLPNGKVFQTKAYNLSDKNIYIQSIKLNGVEQTKAFITHTQLLGGGLLELQMGDKPSKKLGTGIDDFPRMVAN